MLDRITPLVLTLDEAPNIQRLLENLHWANRIVVVDSGSTDGTVEILRSHPHVDLYMRAFDDHAAQWNYGLDQVATEWVLSLDADYALSDSFVDELRRLDPNGVEGFSARFRYRLLGRTLRSALYPPRTVLFHRKTACFIPDGHTQRLEVEGIVHPLESVIVHDDRKPLRRWIHAQGRYAELEADKLLSVAKSQLRLTDRVRRTGWIAPLVMPAYCLGGKLLILEGVPGIYYTLQRTYAEFMIAGELLRRRLGGSGGRDRQRPRRW